MTFPREDVVENDATVLTGKCEKIGRKCDDHRTLVPKSPEIYQESAREEYKIDVLKIKADTLQ